MPARIGRKQLVVAVEFLGGLELYGHRFATVGNHPARVWIQHELGVD